MLQTLHWKCASIFYDSWITAKDNAITSFDGNHLMPISTCRLTHGESHLHGGGLEACSGLPAPSPCGGPPKVL